jgi:hypothetical protein
MSKPETFSQAPLMSGVVIEIPVACQPEDLSSMIDWCRNHVGRDVGQSWMMSDGAFIFRNFDRATAFRRACVDRVRLLRSADC